MLNILQGKEKIMTLKKLTIKDLNFHRELSEEQEKLFLDYATTKQKRLDEEKVEGYLKPQVLKLFEDKKSNTIFFTSDKYMGSVATLIIRESKRDENGNLLNGRIDSKLLKEKYPNIWKECLVPSKSKEIKLDIKVND